MDWNCTGTEEGKTSDVRRGRAARGHHRHEPSPRPPERVRGLYVLRDETVGKLEEEA